MISYQVLGVLHIAMAGAALAAGAFVVALRKGTRVHKIFGYVYVVAMLALNFSTLGLALQARTAPEA